MDILNSTNYEYRANHSKHTQVSSDTKTTQTKSEGAVQAAKQAPQAEHHSIPEGAGETAPSTADQTISKALAASGLPMTDRNRSLVRELLNHKLPVDKQTLQMFAKLAAVHRSASPLTLVLMYKNQIPITPANLRQFEAYQNGNHQLLKDIQSLAKNIMELIKSLQNAKEHGIPYPGGAVTRETVQQSNGTPATGTIALRGEGGEKMTGFHSPLYSSSIAQTGINSEPVNQENDIRPAYPSGTNTLPSGSGGSDSAASSAAFTSHLDPATPILESDAGIAGSPIDQPSSGNSSNTAQTLPAAFNPQTDGVLLTAEQGVSSTVEAANASDLITGKELQQGAVPSPEGTGAGLQSKDLVRWLTETLAASPDQEASSQATHFPKLNTLEDVLLKNVQQPLPEGTHPELSSELLSNLEKLLRQKWTLTPEQVSGKNSLKELYKKLEDDLHRLDGLIKFHRETEEILHSKEPVRNLQDNLQFMKALNQLFSYVQLPLRFQERDVHGEFYVFNKKNALLGKKDILSVLLHLDMTELGTMNIHMKLQQDQIQATFAVENPEAGSIINDHLPELIDALTRKGYHLQARVERKEHPQELLKELLEQNPSGNTVQTFSFDTRA